MTEQLRWIPVTEQLPPWGVVVIVDGGCAYYTQSGEWRSMMVTDDRVIQWDVTHWMPLPKLGEPQ